MEDLDNQENKGLSTTSFDSKTEVDFRLDGPRQTCSFKGNRKLWKAFVSFSKLNYGSVCHILKPFQIAVLTSKVNLSSTIKPLHIENLNIERAVRRVRRYAVEEVSEVVGVKACVVCDKVAYAVVSREDKTRVSLCRVHFEKERARLLGWRVLNEVS